MRPFIIRITTRRCLSTYHRPKPFNLHPADTCFAETWSTTGPAHHVPTKLPSTLFNTIPAFANWFLPNSPNQLNIPYLLSATSQSGDPNFQVPLEITLPASGETEQTSLPFTAFLGYLSAPSVHPSSPRLYLAQHPPPPFLADDIPQPFTNLGFKIRSSPRVTTTTTRVGPKENSAVNVENGGLIDIYSTSLWISRASQATNTPLHRDPNDNLFLQLSSAKIIRCLSPKLGDMVFSSLYRAGKMASVDPRGRIRDGLLTKREVDVMERIIWRGEGVDDLERQIVEAIDDDGGNGVYQTTVERGEAVFIPRGWWHAVKSLLPEDMEEQESKGVATVVASMNWWFR